MLPSEKEIGKSLAPAAADVLSSLAGIEDLKYFTLVGGSALSIYLNHRISENLDFFTWIEKLESARIDSILNNISKTHSVKIINSYADGLDISIDQVKVTFSANGWDKLKERERLLKNSYIGRLELLTAMKINTLSLRAKFRDYYDLYTITKKAYDIKKVLEIALQYIPGMTKKIFATQLVYTEDIDDENIEHLKPESDVSLDDIRMYFEREIKSIH
jgi:hypothetical protein